MQIFAGRVPVHLPCVPRRIAATLEVAKPTHGATAPTAAADSRLPRPGMNFPCGDRCGKRPGDPWIADRFAPEVPAGRVGALSPRELGQLEPPRLAWHRAPATLDGRSGLCGFGRTGVAQEISDGLPFGPWRAAGRVSPGVGRYKGRALTSSPDGGRLPRSHRLFWRSGILDWDFAPLSARNCGARMSGTSGRRPRTLPVALCSGR